MNRPPVLNATNVRMHWELTQIWAALDRDADVRVAVLTGAGDAFCAGGDLDIVEKSVRMPKAEQFAETVRMMRETSAVVYNMVNCEKPIITAVNGTAVGTGLALAVMGDITIVSETARLTDGHMRLGVSAGDHSACLWPLLCGMAKAKLYLLTSDFLVGKEAERIGLFSRAVPREDVLSVAMDYARRLAAGPQYAIRFTKRSLNQWLRLGGLASFDYSLALEMMNFFDVDIEAGLDSLHQKKPPIFPSVKSVGPNNV